MGLPSQPVTITIEELDALNKKLADMRHDVNGTLAIILAAVELMRCKPEMVERFLATLVDQPPKITARLNQFSAEFERALGITKS